MNDQTDYYLDVRPEGVFLKSRMMDKCLEVEHFFTLRSDEPNSANNMGLHTGDDGLTVIENRRKALQSYDIRLEQLVVANQVHGDHIARITTTDAGRGATDHRTGIPETDGMITDGRDIALMTFFADCVPVFLADRQGRAVGLVHAGWKGVALRIAARAVEAMQETYGIRSQDLMAVVGPRIGKGCFQIREDVAQALAGAGLSAYVHRNTQALTADLAGAVQQTLSDAGVSGENIQVWPLCTVCGSELFHSHRRDGNKAGRMAGVIMLK